MKWALLMGVASWAISCVGLVRSPQEVAEVKSRIRDFYSGDAAVMDRAVPKFNPALGGYGDINEILVTGDKYVDPLHRQAQAKARREFQRHRCNEFLKVRFPELDCDRPPSSIEGDDRPENMAWTWIASNDFSYAMDALPTTAKISTPYWSGDYWRMRWGLTSYRYADGDYFTDYQSAITGYTQPTEWLRALGLASADRIEKIVKWSPSEKYDLTVGDTQFGLTVEQKGEGARYLGEDDNVESWFGLCHGWAAASTFVPPPMRSVDALGPFDTRIRWYPEDIRAMVILAWANGRFATNFVGGRCDVKNVTRLENGRISDQNCFDSNPSTFHLVLANLIGKAQRSFVMDASFDHQVWNQPVVEYSFEYFSPLSPEERTNDWTRAWVSYDEKFKAIDRFQRPLTRGRRGPSGAYDDSKIDRIVGVIATVAYVGGSAARHSETPAEPTIHRVTYTYDLELEETGGTFLPTGGEWHENVHPDFLWTPQQGASPRSPEDRWVDRFVLGEAPDAALTPYASSAARRGYPLARVVNALVSAATSPH